MAKNKYYAYYIEQTKEHGIIENWDECKEIVSKQKSRYKGFVNKLDAELWLKEGAVYGKKMVSSILEKGIYFDAGTGRGIGVEVKVTNEKGENILSELLTKDKINSYGNYTAKAGSTNNFGELLGCYIALKIALKENIKMIFGDSKLILDYWSKGIMNRDKLNEDTLKLIETVSKLRKEYEKNGGKLKHISGDINPADLGFHK